MTAIRRAAKAILIAEGLALLITGPVAVLIALAAYAGGGSWIVGLLVPLAVGLTLAPIGAFGVGSFESWGIYGHLEAEDQKREREMERLLEEHGS